MNNNFTMYNTKNIKSNGNKLNGNKKKIMMIVGGIIFFIFLIGMIYYAYKSANEQYKNSPIIVSNPIDAYKSHSGIAVPLSTEGVTQSITTWIYIDDWTYNYGQYKNILWKTTGNIDNGMSSTASHSPSIWLYPMSPHLKINTTSTSQEGVESCDIQNIPLKTWVNICYVLNNRTVDIYINGKLEKSCVLKGVPLLYDSDKIYVTTGSPPGFYGKISRTQYFTKALSPSDVSGIYSYGPNGSAQYQVKFFQDGNFVKIKNDSGIQE